MKTKRIVMTRGQSFEFTETVRDDNGARVDLSEAKVHFAMRADMKVVPIVKLTSEDPLPDGWRAGIVIDDDQDSNRGEYTVTIIPSDTEDLIALGADDPYYYEVWIETAELTYPDIYRSQLDLNPEAGAVP